MMIKDLEMNEDLTTTELSAVRGGVNGIHSLINLMNLQASRATDDWEDAGLALLD